MSQAKKPYHKENLRRDLLDAGRSYVQEYGHLNLSIRTLAQRVGVSSGAPYHHFPDRRAFLLALAIEGFEEMLESARAVAASIESPATKLRKMGIMFIRFAEENPNLIDLMYESELTTPTLDPQLLVFQIGGHDTLRNEIKSALPGVSDDEADLRAIAFWSAVYGFASMRRKGVIHSADSAITTKGIAQAIVDRVVLAAIAN